MPTLPMPSDGFDFLELLAALDADGRRDLAAWCARQPGPGLRGLAAGIGQLAGREVLVWDKAQP